MDSSSKTPKAEEAGLLRFEGCGRGVRGHHAWIAGGLAVATAVFILLINSFLLMDLMRRSAVFMGLVLALTFLLFPYGKGGKTKQPNALDYLLAVASMACGLYIFVTYDAFVARNLQMTTADVAFGVTALFLVLEGGRRCLGIWLPALALLFLLYAIYGQWLPAPLGHFGVRPERLVMRMYLVSEGMFGSIFQIAQTYIGLFVLFGAFLVATGTTEILTQVGLSVSGRFAGGPAKVAVVASGLTGMISGTAAANVATTGTLTIPMMKKAGFRPEFAGAVEAIASTGGLIMPPIMGAAAFLIAEFVGIPYAEVMIGAIIPALLYYGSLMAVIHCRAVKRGIRGLAREEIPPFAGVLRANGHLLIPIVLLVYLLMDGYTPTFAAMYSIAATVALSYLRKSSRLTPRRFLLALMQGGAATVSVSVACLVAGIIVGVISITGVAEVFTSYIEQWSNGSLVVALFLTAIAAMLLSCALPATAVYIVVAVTVAPALIQMGAAPLAAHFFVFWFGVLSNITPPVAIACFTAAGIAGASPGSIAWNAMRMALPAFLIAFVLVHYPDLLFVDWSLWTLVRTLLFSIVGIAAYIVGTEGYFFGPVGRIERVLFLGVMILSLAMPGVLSSWIGIGAFCVLTVFVYWKSARRAAVRPDVA
ncbi:TRAP transporter permease [Shumkonia mesophila]|uniref:TRAP transporter permease n=1 Tax=Shumkonia mesophila TaxID=2838854 RepID=UPI00293419EC|nr:TRAP transporter permease [Shumkonia mesophila]